MLASIFESRFADSRRGSGSFACGFVLVVLLFFGLLLVEIVVFSLGGVTIDEVCELVITKLGGTEGEIEGEERVSVEGMVEGMVEGSKNLVDNKP
jgi:hypothetical protein